MQLATEYETEEQTIEDCGSAMVQMLITLKMKEQITWHFSVHKIIMSVINRTILILEDQV
jgi:hypothetical protein